MKHILLTNDDGIEADGLHYLYQALSRYFLVSVVAPEQQQSGSGHAFTLNKSIRCRKDTSNSFREGFSLSGTPVDCIKLGISKLLSAKPDIIVSGLNDGDNAGVSAFYSGTVAAAREGAFHKIPSVAFSVHAQAKEWMNEYAFQSAEILYHIQQIFESSDHGIYYNINFPPYHPSNNKGICITKQSLATFLEEYKSTTTGTETHFLQLESHRYLEESMEYDTWALSQGYTTITPLQFDTTAKDQLLNLQSFFSIKKHT